MPKRPEPCSVPAARLLLIDHDQTSWRSTAAGLAECFSPPPQLVRAHGGRDAGEQLRAGAYDVVLADLASLGDLAEHTEEAVERLVRLADGALILTLADGRSVSAAVAAMRAGAHDHVAGPIGGAALASRIGELAQRHGKARALTIGRGPCVNGFSGFVGTSSQMQVVYEQIERIARSSAPVFITGESGTGKEVCAEAVHERGSRAHRRFVAINCAAIPRELMESELFGVARGAFTGAHDGRKGAAELADGGTLFLDEIGEMDISLQSKLLRFLQTGCISRVGDPRTRPVDVRVICATNRNPMQLITEKRFREDLFYRLHVLPIHLPPLRQRPADVLVLARHYLERYAQEEHKRFSGLVPEAANLLAARDWPGNVRQLQNLVRRLVVMFDGGGDHLGRDLAAADIESAGLVTATPASAPARPPVLPLWQQDQRIIEDAVASFGGNVALAAAALELSPSTIYRKRQAWVEMDARRTAAA